MKRRDFIFLAGGIVVIGGVEYYLTTDKRNFIRKDIKPGGISLINPKPDESSILYLASLAPSGHNAQPWFIKYLSPYHWIIGNDKTRWLPGVDPNQRETILSLGAFIQNLEYAANNLGYECHYTLLGKSNQDENQMEVLLKKSHKIEFDVQKIIQRRTLRSNILKDPIKSVDLDYLIGEESEYFHFIPNNSNEYRFLNEQTLEANRIQSYRDPAEKELSEWIRFSSKDAKIHCDGLTPASMEIEGIPAWVLRNFYTPSQVMGKGFRDQNIKNVAEQVNQSAGWILIKSKTHSVLDLMETGKRMQRLFLKVREKGLAMHPMSQILEENSILEIFKKELDPESLVQFILRIGYIKNYPDPVSLRRPITRFMETA